MNYGKEFSRKETQKTQKGSVFTPFASFAPFGGHQLFEIWKQVSLRQPKLICGRIERFPSEFALANLMILRK